MLLKSIKDIFNSVPEQDEFEENIVNLKGEKIKVSERYNDVKNKDKTICKFLAWSLFYRERTGNDIYTRDDVLESFYSAMGCLDCEENYLELSAEQASIFTSDGDYFIKTSNGEHFIPINSADDIRDVLRHAVGGTRVDELFEKFCQQYHFTVDENLPDVLDMEILNNGVDITDMDFKKR